MLQCSTGDWIKGGTISAGASLWNQQTLCTKLKAVFHSKRETSKNIQTILRTNCQMTNHNIAIYIHVHACIHFHTNKPNTGSYADQQMKLCYHVYCCRGTLSLLTGLPIPLYTCFALVANMEYQKCKGKWCDV